MLTFPAVVLAGAAVAGPSPAPSAWPITGEKVRVTTVGGRSHSKGVSIVS